MHPLFSHLGLGEWVQHGKLTHRNAELFIRNHAKWNEISDVVVEKNNNNKAQPYVNHRRFNKNVTMFYSILKVNNIIWRNVGGPFVGLIEGAFLPACRSLAARGNEHYRCQLEMSTTKATVWRQGDCDWYRSKDVFLIFNPVPHPSSVRFRFTSLQIGIVDKYSIFYCSWASEIKAPNNDSIRQ